MLPVLNNLRNLDLLSLLVRMVLAVVCGGLIGIEREFKRRPAGFRTHILICLGAAMTTLISQYLFLYMHYYTDMARLGAQVIAGIGFIGAGTIVMVRKQHVKGLTTAAGLWADAIIGLALGAGFYEGAVFATFLLLVAELLFSRLEHYILHHTPEINLYMEYTDKKCLERVLNIYREKNIKVLNMEITRSKGSENHNACAVFCIRFNKSCHVDDLITLLNEDKGIIMIEEL